MRFLSFLILFLAVQVHASEVEDLYLVSLLKSPSTEIANKALGEIIKRLSDSKNSTIFYNKLPVPKKSELIALILDNSSSYSKTDIQIAISKLVDFENAKLILTNYSGSGEAKEIAASTLAFIIQNLNGEIGLAYLTIRTDLDPIFLEAAVRRLKSYLSAHTSIESQLKYLSKEDKKELVYRILRSSSEDESESFNKVAKILNLKGDLEPILRIYADTSAGVQLAAKAIVYLHAENKSLKKLKNDQNPFIRSEAERLSKDKN